MSKRIDDIDKKIDVLKARKATMLAAKKKLERKYDTRRKIILGAIMLKSARENESSRIKVMNMVSGMSENDKKLFDGYFETTE